VDNIPFLLQSGTVNGNKRDEKGTHNVLQHRLSANIVSLAINSHKLSLRTVRSVCYSWQLGIPVMLYINILEPLVLLAELPICLTEVFRALQHDLQQERDIVGLL
jgi:hypothetical protein